MKLNDLLNKYIIIEKRDGKKVEGILIDINKNDETLESDSYTSLTLRIDNNKYKNIHLIEVESIDVLE